MSLDLEAIKKQLNDPDADLMLLAGAALAVTPDLIDEIERLRATLAKVDSWSKFMLGFVDASNPSAIALSSEHSVGEQLVGFRRFVEKGNMKKEAATDA